MLRVNETPKPDLDLGAIVRRKSKRVAAGRVPAGADEYDRLTQQADRMWARTSRAIRSLDRLPLADGRLLSVIPNVGGDRLEVRVQGVSHLPDPVVASFACRVGLDLGGRTGPGSSDPPSPAWRVWLEVAYGDVPREYGGDWPHLKVAERHLDQYLRAFAVWLARRYRFAETPQGGRDAT